MARGSAFWRWRHTRPFWGALFVLLGGVEIFLTVKAPLPVVVHVGMEGFIGYLLPILIALLGVLLILDPAQRLFYSLVAAVLTLATWITSNLGGFVVGLLLGLVGSALAFAWSPAKHKSSPVKHKSSPAKHKSDDQADASTPGVQPETSQSLPRHKRPGPGVLSGE
jgi:hypothetical protein